MDVHNQCTPAYLSINCIWKRLETAKTLRLYIFASKAVANVYSFIFFIFLA